MTEEIKSEEAESQAGQARSPEQPLGTIPSEFRVKFGVQFKRQPYSFNVQGPPKEFIVKNVNISIDGDCADPPPGMANFEIYVGRAPATIYEYAPIIEANKTIPRGEPVRFVIQPKENLPNVIKGELVIELEG